MQIDGGRADAPSATRNLSNSEQSKTCHRTDTWDTQKRALPPKGVCVSVLTTGQSCAAPWGAHQTRVPSLVQHSLGVADGENVGGVLQHQHREQRRLQQRARRRACSLMLLDRALLRAFREREGHPSPGALRQLRQVARCIPQLGHCWNSVARAGTASSKFDRRRTRHFNVLAFF